MRLRKVYIGVARWNNAVIIKELNKGTLQLEIDFAFLQSFLDYSKSLGEEDVYQLSWNWTDNSGLEIERNNNHIFTLSSRLK